MRSSIRYLLLWVLWPCISVPGCGRHTAPPPPDDPSKLRGVTTLYALATRDLGKPPSDMEQLKQVLAPAAKDPASLLVSSRDGQEFAVVWGLDLVHGSPPTDTILAYEKSGRDGTRLVVTCGGDVREVSDEQFTGLRFPRGYRPEVP